MLDTFGFPTPQGSNYQEFYGVYSSTRNYSVKQWIKPRGASMVRIILIGSGGAGYGSSTGGNGGGGSGAVTQWIGPAIFIPDSLTIQLSNGPPLGNPGLTSNIIWQGSNNSSTGYTLLSANSGASSSTGGAGGIVSTNNYFGASGIFTSVAGQAGAGIGASITASTTTFLSGGGGGGASTAAGGSVATKYGYPTVSGGASATAGNSGYFITQPIMLGVGGSGGGGGAAGNGKAGGDGGYGCGGGGAGNNYVGTTGKGGPAACFIWSW